MSSSERFYDYVCHPRYGKQPRITGLNPENDLHGKVFLHWHSPKESRIPNTAIQANLSKQTEATIAVTHYFDVKRRCHDCGRPFIFFAEEQRYWYEELRFPLDSDCIRCIDCRKQEQWLKQQRKRYETLFHVPQRSVAQTLEMADCCLSLIEAGLFHQKQLQHLRMLLNSLQPPSANQKLMTEKLWQRLHTIEQRMESKA